MKIAVVGTGYVGLSISVLLAQHHEVVALDIVEAKVDLINSKKSPIVDKEIEGFLASKELNLLATTDTAQALNRADFVVIATPTNYDDVKNYFNTDSVEAVIEEVWKFSPNAMIVIKSTIPVGFVEKMRAKYDIDNIIFSPEFLREGRAL